MLLRIYVILPAAEIQKYIKILMWQDLVSLNCLLIVYSFLWGKLDCLAFFLG